MAQGTFIREVCTFIAELRYKHSRVFWTTVTNFVAEMWYLIMYKGICKQSKQVLGKSWYFLRRISMHHET